MLATRQNRVLIKAEAMKGNTRASRGEDSHPVRKASCCYPWRIRLSPETPVNVRQVLGEGMAIPLSFPMPAYRLLWKMARTLADL